jgi:membrane-bound serine protease (ClpP class)
MPRVGAMPDCTSPSGSVTIPVSNPILPMKRLLPFRLAAAFILTAAYASAQDNPPATKKASSPVQQAVHVSIGDRELSDPRRWREVQSLLDKAVQAGAPALIFDINSSQVSPQATLPLAEHVARLKTRTIAYINPSAVSGAALLALGCDEIWMAPGSRIGAAAPDLSSAGELTETAQKTLLAQSLAVIKAGARGLSKLKGHRETLAEGFVDADLVIEIDGKVLAAKGQLLLLDADQAVKPGTDGKPLLARGIVADLPQLAKQALQLDSPPSRLADTLFDSPAAPNTPNTAKSPASPKRQGPFTGKVVRIPVGEEDLITPARFEFMSRTLERCTDEAAEAVIFDLDTPGGLAWDTTNLMLRDLQKLGPPSYAFINPRALSAGAMIAVATDAIYIAPAGSAGAATPIYGNGAEMGEAERAKMNSAIMGMARTVAKEKGHDPRVIEAMIDMDRELIVNGQVLCAKGEILTLDAEEATMLSDGKPLFAKAIATSLDEVKTAEGLKGETVTAEPAGFEQMAIWITKYASILILIGIAGAYMEMQAPGFGLPGFVSLIAFSLFFFGHYVAGSLVGHETTVAVAVFLLGILLLITEFFILPGTLVPGIVGFLCVMGALVFTMSGWEVPPIEPAIAEDAAKETARTFSFSLSTYATGLRNFAIGVCGAGVLLLAFARYLPEFGPFKRLTLATTAGGTAAESPAALHAAAVHPGDQGIARSALRPYGTIEIAGRQMEATVEGDYLQTGTPVRIREITGNKIIVEAV